MSTSLLFACPICDSKEISFYETHGDQRKGLDGEWNLWSCQGCSLIFLNPIPTTQELSYFYSKYSKKNEFKISSKAGSNYDELRKIYHLITGDIDPRDFIEDFTGKRILDFGFGQAPYLSYFSSKGADVAGIEIADYIVSEYENQGYDVKRVEDFNQIPYQDSEFDIIYLMQVFEHLANPDLALQEINRIAKKGSIVYMALPNANSYWRKFFGENWIAGWFTPFHIHFYNVHILNSLAERHGFNLTEYWSSTPELWFRLNLKSWIFKQNQEIDSLKVFWLDNLLSRTLLMLALRLIELFIKEKDCLLVKLEKNQ